MPASHKAERRMPVLPEFRAGSPMLQKSNFPGRWSESSISPIAWGRMSLRSPGDAAVAAGNREFVGGVSDGEISM